MAKIALTSVAIAGSGEASDETLAGLLDDQLPQKLGAVFRPNRMPRHLRALHSARAWLESPDVLGANGTVGTDDIIESLLSRRNGDGSEENPGSDTVELYVLWPEEPSEDEVKLVKGAFDNGIRVRNLSAMLQDLDPDEVFPPGPEDEEETAEILAGETAMEAIAEGEAHALPRVNDDGLLAGLTSFITKLVYDIAREEGWPVGGKVETVAKEVAAKVEGKPPFDPPFVEPKTPDGTALGTPEKAPGKVKYFYDKANDRYRVAKFRPKAAEETVYLTEEEIEQVVRAGLVTD